MSEYNFDYDSLSDRITDLENEVERLKYELIETDNTIYEILNRLDKMEGFDYNTNITNGEPQ
jgi:archaellum component FlaC